MLIRICAVLAGIVSFSISVALAQNPFEITSRLQTKVTSTEVATVTSSVVSKNPFEITNRLQTKVTSTEAVTAAPSVVSKNLFEVERNETANKTFPVVSETPKPSTATPPTQGNRTRGAGEFGITLLSIVPVTFLFMLFRQQFGKAYRNLFNFNILQQSYREFKGAFIVPVNLWYLAFWVNSGIFLALAANRFGFSITQHIFMDALLGIAAVSGLLLAKHIFNSLLQQIYKFDKELTLYNYLLMLLGIVLGVLLVPVNLVLAYADYQFIHILIYLTSLFLVLAFIFLAIRGIIIGNSYLSMHGFHFLLYICAVEIAPILILVKVGLVFINK